jgi:putative nucleotidyltransferase with HDIG domain
VAGLLEEAQRAERAGYREICRRHCESALYLLRHGDERAASGIIRRIARTYIDEGHFDAGLDCLEASQAIARALNDKNDVALAINLMGIASLQRGDLDTAEELFIKAGRDAAEAGNELVMALVNQNLGIISGIRGDLNLAVEHLAKGLEGLQRLRATEHLPAILSSLGLSFMQLERYDEAQAAFEDALQYCTLTGNAAQRLMVEVNMVDLLITRSEWARAADLCQVVLTEATIAEDQRTIAETYKHRGVIARARGDFDAADKLLAAAYEIAMRREDLLLAAEAARERAELHDALGQNKDTLQALTLSHRLFQKLRAERALADLSRRVGRLEERFYLVVRRWAETIESKDPYTLGHCERVATYATALARDAGLEEITMFWFRLGALLHDVGKVVVPSEILNKEGPLTDEERTIMEKHPAAGEDLLRDIEFPWDILPMIRGHHERWDGAGYPDRLSGENIAFSARVLCVADVYDALTTDRPYRQAFSQEEALAMMAADSGKMFDPDLFRRFQEVLPTLDQSRGRQEPLVQAS